MDISVQRQGHAARRWEHKQLSRRWCTTYHQADGDMEEQVQTCPLLCRKVGHPIYCALERVLLMGEVEQCWWRERVGLVAMNHLPTCWAALCTLTAARMQGKISGIELLVEIIRFVAPQREAAQCGMGESWSSPDLTGTSSFAAWLRRATRSRFPGGTPALTE